MDKTAYTINQNGFTLIELLAVLGIIGVLFIIVITALNPIFNFAEARNARRWNHVNGLSIAIYNYIVDHDKLPSGLSSREKQIGTAQVACDTACGDAYSQCLNLAEELQPYLEYMPVDPKGGTEEQTLYAVAKGKSKGITVRACNAENGRVIEVTR